jgi:hypothetical protein
MDKNLFFIDDRKMQENAIKTMAILQAEIERRKVEGR